MVTNIKPSIELSPLWSVQRKKIRVKDFKINISENFKVNEWSHLSSKQIKLESFNTVFKGMLQKGWTIEDISPVGRTNGNFLVHLYRVTPTSRFDNFLDEIIAEKLSSSKVLRSLKPSRMVFMAVLGIIMGLLLGLIALIVFQSDICSFLKINDFLIF